MTDRQSGPERVFRLDRVTKSYGGKLALAALSFTISAGEAVAVVGPSGSGKTTLLHLLASIIRPDGGAVALNGHDLLDLEPGPELSALVGVIHQQFELVPHLNVMNNVLAGRLGQWSIARSLLSLVSPRDRHMALAALERVGLSDRPYERTSRLSGGEQQRVAIARLLVQDPGVLIADEPVASLDPTRAEDIVGLLARIAGEYGKTLIASIHSIELARRYFTRVIGLRLGEMWFDLPVDRVTDELLTGLYELQGLESEGVGQT